MHPRRWMVLLVVQHSSSVTVRQLARNSLIGVALAVDGVISGAPWKDMASGRAEGAHRLRAPRPSVTER